MKKLKRFIPGLLCLLVPAIVWGMVTKFNSPLVNAPITTSTSFSLNLNSYGIDSLSVSVVATTSTFAQEPFTDGQASTGTIVVTSTTGLSAVQATDTLTVLSTQSIGTGAQITVNGVPLINQVHWWFDQTYTTATAISIKQAINQYVSGVIASTGSSTVVIKASQFGSYGNNMTLVSNISTITAASANFTGGKDSATISINGIVIPFTPATTSSMTALSIQNGINGSTALHAIVIATVPAGTSIVSATSTAVGANTNYVITSSTDSSLTVGGSTKTVTGLNGASIGQMWGGKDSAITLFNGTTTVITSTAVYNYPTGLAVLYAAGSQAIPGLTTGTTYFIVPVTPYAVSLASTSTGAFAGATVNITSSPIKSTADTFTLTPLALTGIPSYRWEVSNDGNNWYPYTNTSYGTGISSVTFSAFVSTGVVNTWDFGPVDWAWLRFNYVSTTTFGAVNIKVMPNGKGAKE